MQNSTRRLLILSCSKRKCAAGRAAKPAIKLYDGPAFRTFRAFSAMRPGNATDLAILSAKHGFITAGTRIANYDQRIGPGKGSPASRILRQVTNFARGKRYREVFVNVGADYRPLLPDLRTTFEGGPCVEFATGRIGKRLHEMKEWLYSIPPCATSRNA